MWSIHTKTLLLYLSISTVNILHHLGGSDGKESACNVGDLGSIPGLGISPGEKNGYPLQDSGGENSVDREAWQAIFHGVSKSWTWLSDFHFNINKTFYFIGMCSNVFLLSWDILALLNCFSFIWKLEQKLQENKSKYNMIVLTVWLKFYFPFNCFQMSFKIVLFFS